MDGFLFPEGGGCGVVYGLNASLLLPHRNQQSGYTHAADIDGNNHANFRSLIAAIRWVKKMGLGNSAAEPLAVVPVVPNIA